MADAEFLWPGGPRYLQSPHFALSTDSVLLADFARTGPLRRGIDLGCGGGILPLLLLTRSLKPVMTGLELLPEAAAVAEENMRQNGLDARCGIVTGDIRDCPVLFPAGSFDFAVSNPPYYAPDSGYPSPCANRAAARTESCALRDVCAAAAYLLRTGGAFYLVYKPERLAELCCALSGAGLEPKRLRLVQHSAAFAPSLVLMEGHRGGKAGLRVEPPLLLTGPDGRESAEARRIYHREDRP